MPRPLNEQVVVIIGASSGIDRSSAVLFGQKGSSVVLAARNGEALEAAARETDSAGGSGHVVATDVAEWGQVQRLAAQAVERFGRLDAWVNNAAIRA